ncbi:DUF3572 family protein [Meridianimarinicoccus sp. RP-17]|uniref:DUF3572 family protein n=1 Tax=Meridianimarinicoccus zhengii TaxID=2056810 RepID=UPI000DAB535D|nr:DUF3572 family protein [Phycocomes zhengii]
MSPSPAPSDDAAITLALGALAHMARSDALSARFLGDTGMSPGDIAAQAADPEFLAAVLDFYLADETALLELAADLGRAPEAVAAARRGLPGGVLPHWT